MRIATFNLENLFTRPTAMADGTKESDQQAIDDHATLNRIVAKEDYSETDKAVLIDLDGRYRFSALNTPDSALVVLQKVRGRLYSRSEAGVVSVVANGRSDWTGWFELKRTDVSWTATENTARVIDAVSPDIVICVEVENRPTLGRFNEQVLGAVFDKAYPHVMVIDGNDRRGIDVGIMSRYPIVGVRSHVDDLNAKGEPIFSRDCPQYGVKLPDGRLLIALPNHFKSKRGGNDDRTKAQRLGQARRAHELALEALEVTPLVLVGGDLNDEPASDALAPLWQEGFTDVMTHRDYPTDRPGTYGTGLLRDKIDYLIMSPGLRAALRTVGIERRGSYHPRSWEPFPSVRSKADEASDHHLVWADFDL